MAFIRVVEVDGEEYTEKMVRGFSFDQVKMLISFIDNEKDLNVIKVWYGNAIMSSYIDNLISKVNNYNQINLWIILNKRHA